MTLETMVRSLNSLGIEYKVLETGSEGAALIMPEYGRIIGLWPHWRVDNAFWVNPEFFRSLEIGAKQTEWVNPGGDRMWLCPESEFFVADARRPAETYDIPRALDPGSYSAAVEKGAYRMENRGEVWAFRSEARIGFRIVRRIRAYGEKELAGLWGVTYLRQAGYEEETTLEVRGAPMEVGLWDLVLLNVGGEVYLPLQKPWADTGLKDLPAGSTEPQGTRAVARVRGDAAVRVRLDSSEVKARGAYFSENKETGRAVLLLKEFDVSPADRYAREHGESGGAGYGREAPLASGAGNGWAVGISYAGRHATAFEMGFRSPALGGRGGKKKGVWRSSLWVFSGRTEEVRTFLERVTA